MSMDSVVIELLDDETRKMFDLWAPDFARAVLGLYQGASFDSEARIASARAAKSNGVPLWQWAEEYQDD